MNATEQNVGIVSVGVYLPEEVRRNDWWPEAIRTKWQERAQAFRPDEKQMLTELARLPPGAMLVAKAIAEGKGDTFYGARERRVAPKEMPCSDMETRACADALARAGLATREVDLLLGNSSIPDYMLSPNVVAVHHKLGLGNHCMSIAVDNSCSSFLIQFTTAEAMMRAGRAKYALLYQSCAMRIASPENPQSAWFGDGATAVLLGPVAAGRGILGSAHRTNSKYHEAIVATVPGKRWYDEGRVEWMPKNRDLAKEVIFTMPDCAKEVVEGALAEAKLGKDDVDFYACHQATTWSRRVTQEYVGLTRARSVDTYGWAGSLSAANIPLVLATAEREGQLRDNDVVAAYAGGSGITYGSIVLRWGR